MAATDTTTNFNLNLTDFDKIPWGEEQHNNWHIMDALMARFVAISLIQGAWENALIVAVGDRYIDTDQDLIYEVLVAHTTPSTGTFAAARIATSTNWQAVTVDVANKGTYAQATVYSPNNFVQDGGRFGLVQIDYTSDNTAATTALSYDADVTNGDIITLLDASALIAATHDTNTVATGGTPTATYTASTNKFDFGLVTGATGATGATGPGSGTVTQINAGDGFSFSAITTTGTIAVDGNLQDLDALGAVSSNSEMIVGTGAGAYAYESGSTLRTSIGVAIGTDVLAQGHTPIGQHTIWVPASAMEAAVTTAAATSNAVEIGTSLFAARTMDFATGADDFCYFGIQFPKSWAAGTLVCQFVWSATGTTANTVLWAIAATSLGNDEVLTTAFPTPASPAADTNSTTADDLMISAEVTVTVGSTPTAEDFIIFEVSRDVSGDTLAEDARLHGIKIHYTTDTGSDT